jgi:peptidoglycan/xylan/chitin deacetylase (PgdA/CDA1 family)
LNRQTLENKVCLTFDDGLLSQYDIALPVLENYNLNAFWFVNTLPVTGKPIYMEIFRKFKHEHFNTSDEYYELFFRTYSYTFKEEISESDMNGYLNQFSFYTSNDRKYRFIRDKKLTQLQYENLILSLIEKEKWDINYAIKNTWLNESHIKTLNNKNHIIGLHSHSHPIGFNQLDYNKQYLEYKTNQDILHQITGKKPDCMAHPINSYNNNTLKVLTELNVKLGFCSNNSKVQFSNLELPRLDHTLAN